jgi:hypothetical protein
MKLKLIAQIAMVMFVTALATMTGLSQTTFFNDTFVNGSTVNSTPVPPTANSTSYEIIGNPGLVTNITSLTPGNLTFGTISNNTSAVAEVQALFSADPINLTSTNDYLTLVIVFTNQSLNTLSRAYIGAGLYNTGASTNYPVPGGMNGTLTSASTGNALNNAQLWQGYFGEQTSFGNAARIYDRPPQTTTDNRDQELLVTGSGTYAFGNPAGTEVGPSDTVGGELQMSNETYTEVFTISLASPTSLAITNWLYAGTVTNSPNLYNVMGGIATNGTFLTTGFNALGFGWYSKVATGLNNIVGISSINVFGHSTAVTGPPIITAQPTNAVAVTNSYVQFATAAVGADATYQWYLNGNALANAGNYSGVTSDTLAISPAAATNAATLAHGYYCTISGAGGYFTNTITNSLTLVSETNLIWTGSSTANWDVDTTANWETTNSSPVAAVFTPGDPVSFNDPSVQDGHDAITLVGNIAPASVSVVTAAAFTFSGTGTIQGPASAVFDGENYLNSGIQNGGEVILNANNTYTGGTLLTNGIYVDLENYGGLGNGPVILGSASAAIEITTAGGATTGVNGNIDVVSNGEFLVDGAGSFATVFFGNITGSPTATLTLEPSTAGTATGAVLGNNSASTNFYRFYSTNIVCNANIFIDGPSTSQAQYNGDVMALYNASGSQVYNGVISGNGGVIIRGGGNDIFTGQNTYTGGTTPTTGTLGIGASSVGTPGSLTSGPLGTGYLLVAPEAGGTTGTGIIFSSGGSNNIGNAIVYPSGTNSQVLEISGSNNLTFSGPVALNSIDGNNTISNQVIQVVNTGLTKFSGNITDGGIGYGLGFYGATNGLVALSGADSYTGKTGITNITVLVDGTLSTSAVNVTNGGTLGGSGSITAPVTIQSGGNLAAGDQAPGTLTVNGTLTLQAGSTNIAYVSGSSGNSKVTVSSITYAGTLAPVITSGTVTAGQTFTIFSAGSESGNFSSPITGSGWTWSFSPSTGVLTAVSSGTIVPNVPPHVTSFSLVGNNVSISGTNGVNGGTYYLLGQTNVALPINQWYPVATNVVTASGSTNGFSFTGTNVFSATTPELYLILSSTNN